jgi:hypothetical protein
MQQMEDYLAKQWQHQVKYMHKSGACFQVYCRMKGKGDDYISNVKAIMYKWIGEEEDEIAISVFIAMVKCAQGKLSKSAEKMFLACL